MRSLRAAEEPSCRLARATFASVGQKTNNTPLRVLTSSIRTDRGDPAVSVDRCLPATADDSGSACAMITAAFAACLEGLGEIGPVQHPTCESRGDESCRWELAATESKAWAETGTR